MNNDQRTGTFAVIAIIAAVASFAVTCTGNPIWGFVLALISLPLGITGMVMAASPRVTGGIMSIIAIVLGVLGLGVSVLGMLGALGGAIAS